MKQSVTYSSNFLKLPLYKDEHLLVLVNAQVKHVVFRRGALADLHHPALCLEGQRNE